MDRLVEVFNNEELVPMKQGGHAPAKDVFRGAARLSDIIEDKDLAKIIGDGHSLPLWIANPPQRNQREDRFLSMLKITKWATTDLIKLSAKSETIKTWLKDKSDKWHQEFYALLGDFLSNQSMYTDDLSNISIVRISDGTTYKKGKDCYFPSDDMEHDEKFPRVSKGVYSSGKNKDQQKKAREFLEDIDVSEVEESDRVEAILKQRYGKGAICGQHHEQDIKRFIALIEKQPSRALLFKNYFIFKIDKNLDNKTWWAKPSIVFLDSPYRDTGLGAYYDALGEDSDRKWALSPKYEKYGIDPERLGKFAKAVGAQTKLEVKPQEIPRNHPEYSDLKSAPGERLSNVINIDRTIPEFKVLLDKPNLDKARLIWRTMDSLDDDDLKAKYRKNATGGFHYGASSFVHDLRRAAWVPQKYRGEPLRFVHPCDASSDYLPEGFSYESWREWIRKIEFGKSWQDQEEQERRRKERATQEYQRKEEVAIEMGFDSAEEAEELARLKKKAPEAFKEFIQKKKAKEQRPTFPEKTSNNPDRRQEKVKEQLDDASDKEYEERKRSVRISQGAVVPKIDLREQYTNDSGEMVCQICEKEMPFKKRDGEYYFEAVEALSKDYFPKEYEAQSIALCPLCAARYKEFVIRDEDAMTALHRVLKDSDDREVPLQLGELATSIRFVQTHRQDMKTILQNRA